MQEWMDSMKARFILNFIKDDRWKYLADGLVVTLRVTFFSVILGILIGMVVASIRATRDKTKETMRQGIGKAIIAFLDWICRVYLTVIRGTPVVVQLMIFYFIIFVTSNNPEFVAVLSFGINSGAYVAEIMRSGIMSIDEGQTEAGRSLGLNFVQTMALIVLPQAFKNILPALANEFIVLLKETSVLTYLGLKDLNYGGAVIISRTYDNLFVLLAVAAIYLVLVMFFSWLVSLLERRLRKSER